MPSHAADRLADVALEDGAARQPLAGLFLDLQDVPLQDALQPLLALLPRNGSIRADAGLRQVQAKAQRARARHPKLTQDQAVCIVLYTTEEPEREQSVYFGLNAALRSHQRGGMRDWRDYVWLLLGGLKSLPPQHVPRVLRGVARPFADLGGYAIGAQVQWAAFSSCAIGAVSVMQDFIGPSGDRTIFQVELCEGTGRDLHEFSFFPGEAELLLPPNLCMRVKRIQHNCLGSPGLTLVELHQEITQDMIADLDPTIRPARELRRLLGEWWPTAKAVAAAVQSAHAAGMAAHGGPPAELLQRGETLLVKRLGISSMRIEELGRVLDEYMIAPGVVLAALQRLAALCDDRSERRSWKDNDEEAAAGVLPSVIAAMRTHAASQAVQSRGCITLGSICAGGENSSLARKQQAADAGALSVIIAAMNTYAQSTYVLYGGCFALASICSGTDAAALARKQLAADEGALMLLVSIVQANGGLFEECDTYWLEDVIGGGPPRRCFNSHHVDAIFTLGVICEGNDDAAAARQQTLVSAGGLPGIFSAHAWLMRGYRGALQMLCVEDL